MGPRAPCHPARLLMSPQTAVLSPPGSLGGGTPNVSQAASSPSLLSASCLQTSHHRTDLQALTPNRRQRVMHHKTPVMVLSQTMDSILVYVPSGTEDVPSHRNSCYTNELQFVSTWKNQRLCVCVNAKEGQPSPALWGSCQPDTNRPPVAKLQGASTQSTYALRGVFSHSAELHNSRYPRCGNAGHPQSRGP